jgi:hypothetical protein
MNYNIELTQQDIQVLIAGLGELPLKAAWGTVNKLQAQVAAQDAAGAVELETLKGE